LGHIRIADMEVTANKMDMSVLRRRVGMIFQRPNPFPMSIRKNLALTLKQHGIKDKHIINEKIESTLQAVGLWDEVKDRLDASALVLSGGQQQRLCIARAIALEPDVVLFDEPCSALDPMASGTVEDLILDLRNKFTVVIVTHNLAQARRIADTVAVFWTKDGVGQLIEHGPTSRLFESPGSPISAAYLAGRQG
jgi:phosphate transport system ATP-binding protein